MGIELALVQLMRLCSTPSSGGASGSAAPAAASCCKFHACITRLQEGLSSLGELSCAPGFQARPAAQCGRCGFLVDAADVRAPDRAPATRIRCFACQAEVTIGTAREPAARGE